MKVAVEVKYHPFEKWPYEIKRDDKKVKLTRKQAVILLMVYYYHKKYHEPVPLRELFRMVEMEEGTVRKCVNALIRKNLVYYEGYFTRKVEFTSWGHCVALALYKHEKERGALHGF